MKLELALIHLALAGTFLDAFEFANTSARKMSESLQNFNMSVWNVA